VEEVSLSPSHFLMPLLTFLQLQSGLSDQHFYYETKKGERRGKKKTGREEEKMRGELHAVPSLKSLNHSTHLLHFGFFLLFFVQVCQS
jgi:hypothetical protein